MIKIIIIIIIIIIMTIKMNMINKNENENDNDNDNVNDTKQYSNWGYQDSFYFFMKDILNVKNRNKKNI